ncbi:MULTISPECIES: DUF6167 family protein [unclassified Streptomyces]|uniref:DUF6167 family protein n=1 Tax=unclassified Streptomyces TaxID=2593676 RepID=UPI001C59F003|nr:MULTISPECIES: DUF6167 family protein [unclassified Streptomyces]MBW1596751.1 hypothetical protein [Streptomyces sp. JJ38]MCZ7413293.1 DUF6167 family protein [Streptomyces sp. WMMC897]MCZ7430287.1 DUF6167 family protein [Streptomyces sp. WMMC1477]
MFRRTFWFTAGAAAGVWATSKVNRKLRTLAPDSLAVRAADRAVVTGNRLRELAADVRTGMAQREHELNEALGLNDDPDAPAPTYLTATPSPRTLSGSRPRAERGLPHRTTGKEDH